VLSGVCVVEDAGATLPTRQLGNEPGQVFQELADITLVDVVFVTCNEVAIRNRCSSQPTEQQAILWQHLNLHLPKSLEMAQA
jgi:hypothetical protein